MVRLAPEHDGGTDRGWRSTDAGHVRREQHDGEESCRPLRQAQRASQQLEGEGDDGDVQPRDAQHVHQPRASEAVPLRRRDERHVSDDEGTHHGCVGAEDAIDPLPRPRAQRREGRPSARIADARRSYEHPTRIGRRDSLHHRDGPRVGVARRHEERGVRRASVDREARASHPTGLRRRLELAAPFARSHQPLGAARPLTDVRRADKHRGGRHHGEGRQLRPSET
jgi:hypothetical protein